jgi:hypothetical protein
LAVTYPQLPDAEAALVGFLAAHSVLAPLHGGRVGTELQSDLACLQVTALGGPQPWPWESAPEFAISSWGPNDGTGKAAASALDRAVRIRGVRAARHRRNRRPGGQRGLPARRPVVAPPKTPGGPDTDPTSL